MLEVIFFIVCSAGPSESTDDDDTDTETNIHRGRPSQPAPLANYSPRTLIKREVRSPSRREDSSEDRDPSPSRAKSPVKPSFLQAPSQLNGHPTAASQLAASIPNWVTSQARTRGSHFFADYINLTWRVPCGRTTLRFHLPVTKALEAALLILSLLYAQYIISAGYTRELQLSTGLGFLAAICTIYFISTHISRVRKRDSSPPRSPSPRPVRLASEGVSKKYRRGSTSVQPALSEYERRTFARVFLTSLRNYRDVADDGAISALVIPPLVACGAFHSAINAQRAGLEWFPGWLIEPSGVHVNGQTAEISLDAIIRTRRNLVELCSMCSTLLIVHFLATKMSRFRKHHREASYASYSPASWLTENEMRRVWLYIGFTIVVTLGAVSVKVITAGHVFALLKYMSYKDVILSALFFQFALYTMVRLARRGFTMGELGLVAQGATVLFLEAVNFVIAKVFSPGGTAIRTYRFPTPLLVFQHALLPGSILIGFLLSPLLYLSRHIASRRFRHRDPAEDMRWRKGNNLQRRFLALGFYGFAALIIGGPIGLYTQWCLDRRNPWMWVIYWLLEGRRSWSRPILVMYWGLLGTVSVWGWNRRLARTRRVRLTVPVVPHATQMPSVSVIEAEPSPPTPSQGGMLNQANEMAVELLEAADKRVPVLSLNARRKFFHALAVVMFMPGIATDPAFTHLSFSAAFALFTFAEYARYFALYPFGASVHMFLSDFLDHKDSGTAILSHFYLLTGCAGGLWLEGPSKLLLFSGVLSIGIGDAVASVVGKRIGRLRWSGGTTKTVEGSASFVGSVIASGWMLRMVGAVEAFSTLRFGLVGIMCAALEAWSVQNDNLTLPLYMWAMAALLDVA